jgi:type IV secretory pathway TrbD component
LWLALAGLVIWPVGLAGAVRLAKPGSLWAHRFYRDGRMQRSRERYPEPTDLRYPAASG